MDEKTLSLGIVGISGRMGTILADEISKDKSLILIGGVRKKSFAKETTFRQDILSLAEKADIIIDFSSPEALCDILNAAEKYSKPLLIGTTGFNEKQEKSIFTFAKKIPIILCADFSFGIALCKLLISLLGQKLKGHSAQIVETGHKSKRRPSDTSLILADSLFKNGIYNVDIHSIRKEEDISKHSLSWILEDEKIELVHEEHSKKSRAKTVLKCAKFLLKKKPGLYSLEDALF